MGSQAAETAMRPSDRVYYHGTFSQAAVDDLQAGGVLEARRPEGRAAFAASAPGLCYLTPSFHVAADYAMMLSRSDWASAHGCRIAARSHVFSFDLSEVCRAVPEEDELGWAVGYALRASRGDRGGPSVMNHAFCRAVEEDEAVQAALRAEAGRVLRGLKRFAPIMDRPQDWRAGDRTAAGRRLAGSLDPELAQRLADMGISLGIAEPVRATGAWCWDRRALRGFMDAPEKADEVPGAWSAGPGMRA